MPKRGGGLEREVVFCGRKLVGVPNLWWQIWRWEHFKTRGFRAEKPPNGQQEDKWKEVGDRVLRGDGAEVDKWRVGRRLQSGHGD